MMTTTEQVTTVLEKMGFVYIEEKYDYLGERGAVGTWKLYDNKGQVIQNGAPDLLRSLDAIAQARGMLNTNEQCDYANICCEMVRREENIAFGEDPKKVFPFNCFGYFGLLNLTPAQHLEALCRT